MALHTLGTAGTTTLQCLAAWTNSGAGLVDGDIGAISMSITDDAMIASILGGGAAGPGGVLCTGNTHTNTTLDTLVQTGGGPLTTIAVNDLVLGNGIPAGTFVQAFSGTTVTLTQAATATAAIRCAFIGLSDIKPGLDRAGNLWVPRRGKLQLWPGDIVAVDNTGAVILVPGASINYAQSNWVFT